jgi:epoxyqueuosine reductase
MASTEVTSTLASAFRRHHGRGVGADDDALRRARWTAEIKAEARRLGFDAVGVAAAGPADPQGNLRRWLERGLGGELAYLAESLDTREDVRRYVPNAQSVIALATSYYAPEAEAEATRHVARYARGADYHNVLRRRLRSLRKFVLARDPEPDARCAPSIDFTPILERAWAAKAGIAWIGKSTMAIGPRLGTYTYLSALITSLPLDPDPPIDDRCGTCTACLDACPTQAFVEPYVLDATRCISYWTVERRGAEAPEAPPLHGWIAGCDVCQEVCPWNKFAAPVRDARLAPRPELARVDLDAWADGPSDTIAQAIEGSALTRIGADGLQRLARRARAEAHAARPVGVDDDDDPPR